MLIDLGDVQVSVAAETALAYLTLRTAQYQLVVARDNLAIQRETHAILDDRWQSGLGNELALQQATYNLESTRSAIPTLEAEVESAYNALCVLVGDLPGTLELAPLSRIPHATVAVEGFLQIYCGVALMFSVPNASLPPRPLGSVWLRRICTRALP